MSHALNMSLLRYLWEQRFAFLFKRGCSKPAPHARRDDVKVWVWGRCLKPTTIILLPLFLLPSQSSSSLISCWSLLQSSSTCVVHPLRFSCCSSWISNILTLSIFVIRFATTFACSFSLQLPPAQAAAQSQNVLTLSPSRRGLQTLGSFRPKIRQ